MVRVLSASRFLTGLLFLLPAAGCGGESAPAQSPPPAPPPAAEPPQPEPAATASSGTDDAWEGEAEAKNGTAAADGGKGAETRTNEVIAKVVRDNRKPFRDCFEAAAKELPDLEGTMTLNFVLDPEGKVKSAELNGARSTIKAASVVTCSINVLKQLKFPASSRGMESVVNYPFDFRR